MCSAAGCAVCATDKINEVGFTLVHIYDNSSGADVCATDASCDCINVPGNFTCTCNHGYTEDGASCRGK